MANLTGLEMSAYVDYIKLMLGGSVLELENEQDLSKIVNASLQELRHYISDVRKIKYSSGKKMSRDTDKSYSRLDCRLGGCFFCFPTLRTTLNFSAVGGILDE